MTQIEQQLACAADVVQMLQAIGCRVISIACESFGERACVQIDDPGALLDHLDEQMLWTGTRYIQRGVIMDDVRVNWLTRIRGPEERIG